MPCVLTCLKSLTIADITLSLMCLQFLRALRALIFYVPYVSLFLPALGVCTFVSVFNFWRALGAFTNFMRCGATQNQLPKAEMSKKSYFVFQNLDRFDFKLVLRKQPLWGVLKILIRMTYFEWITCQEPETLLLQGFLVEFNMILFWTIISKNSFFLILKISLYLIEEK